MADANNNPASNVAVLLPLRGVQLLKLAKPPSLTLNPDPALRQVLLSLPCISPQDLPAFEDAFAKTPSRKEQKQHMKSLLLLGTANQLKALASQKSVNVITNISEEGHAAHSMLRKLKLKRRKL